MIGILNARAGTAARFKDLQSRIGELLALLYKLRDCPIFLAELSDAVLEMANAADGTKDEPGAKDDQTKVQGQEGQQQGHYLVEAVITDVAMSTLSTEKGKANTAVPVRREESAVRFSARSTWILPKMTSSIFG